MVGHVNMMDDVLISNLPPEYLRSALRVLIAEGSAIQQPFVRHVRDRLQDPKPELYPARELFPGADELTPKCTTYLSLTRCLFLSKLVQLSLPYLDHLIRSLSEANATWTGGSELHRVLGDFSGDIVQAMQALKEVDPAKDDVLKGQLLKLHSSLLECRHYCEAHEPTALEYPFRRSERQVVDVVDIFYPGHSSDLVPGRGDSEVPDFLDISFGEVAETFVLGPFHIPRLFNGFWQLSSPAWGAASSNSQDAALTQLLHSGLTAADMADHYGDAELVYGQFRNRLPQQVKHKVFAATKWCVFKPIGCKVTDEWVLEAVKERCRRLGGRVELLQFHWYDYDAKEYLDVLLKLVALTKTHPELVSTIGLCNFDSSHVQEACEYLLSRIGAVGIVSNQIQFSVIDSRPLQQMCSISAKYGLKLLTYGSFCGGFLSSRWLNQRLPTMYSASRQLTPSQRKYLGMISDWGSWDDFQALLSRLSVVAEKHSGATLTNVAIRWVLQKPQVGAVIVGTRLGITTHDQDNLSVLKFRLDEEDTKAIDQIALGRNTERTSRLFEILGDCGNEYRKMH
ncbi:putative aryl-alcohol dehydrogenase [Xylaria arbuscula]|nr:putative aryl-alcohol dehydrogenase [Xylaria arbuscula]